MKKRPFKKLDFKRKVVATFNSNDIKGGGVSGACTSSIKHPACIFACPESVYASCD
ncbi:hypothetical protein [Ascidiimonas aurantiaca]|uniref:hypothetical protein n=1 Tax=Ascidiimonas aurantiaca TaxID=1685432 RepID=UPI0030EEA57A